MNSIGINPSTEAPQFLNQWAHFKLQKRHSAPLVHACIVETNASYHSFFVMPYIPGTHYLTLLSI